MKKLVANIYYVLILSIIFSCTNNVKNCSDFDNNKLLWTPYNTNDTIVLKNGASNIKLVVEQILVDHKTSYSENEDCGGCIDQLNFRAKSDTMNIELKGFSSNNSDFNETLTCETANSSSTSSKHSRHIDYTANNVSYKDVKVFKTSGPIAEMVFVKNYGLMVMRTNNNSIWINTQVPNRSGKIKTISIIENICN